MLGGVGGADPQEFLRHHWQACFTSEHQRKDKEGERFGTVSMYVWEELAHLGGPLAPEIERCFHEESVPFHEAVSLLCSW